jgi:hypothetical protein
MAYITEELLILAKTYPIPSDQRRETTCVAAINRRGELRRLYPIPFRFMDDNLRFKKWEWIQAKIDRASSDRRPESYRIDIDTISKLKFIPSDNNWEERINYIKPHILKNFYDLEERRKKTGESLGFVRPINIKLEIAPAKKPDWSPNELANLTKEGLFDNSHIKNRDILKKVPYDFHYNYQCPSEQGFTVYTHKINDWESGSLYWNCVKKYGKDWEKYFRQKLELEFSQKDLIFMLGTMHRIPDQWLIISLIYPPQPKQAKDTVRQLALDFLSKNG